MTTGQQSAGPRTGARTGGMRRPKPRFFPRRKVCTFCMDHVKEIDYKDVNFLRKFTSDQFKIESRRKTGTCAKHQRALAVAIKRARQLSLMPLTPANKGRGQRWMAG